MVESEPGGGCVTSLDNIVTFAWQITRDEISLGIISLITFPLIVMEIRIISIPTLESVCALQPVLCRFISRNLFTSSSIYSIIGRPLLFPLAANGAI